jgi:hypothetical protein
LSAHLLVVPGRFLPEPPDRLFQRIKAPVVGLDEFGLRRVLDVGADRQALPRESAAALKDELKWSPVQSFRYVGAALSFQQHL